MLFEVFLFGSAVCHAATVGTCCEKNLGSGLISFRSWECDEHSTSNRVCEKITMGETTCDMNYDCCETELATCAGKNVGDACYSWRGKPTDSSLFYSSGQFQGSSAGGQPRVWTGGTCQSVLHQTWSRRKRMEPALESTCEKGVTHEMRCVDAEESFVSWGGEPTSSLTPRTHHVHTRTHHVHTRARTHINTNTYQWHPSRSHPPILTPQTPLRHVRNLM